MPPRTYSSIFELPENQKLIAIRARILIKKIGIGGVVWGLYNIAMGALWSMEDLVNMGVLVLGLCMLAAGVYALRKPRYHSLHLEVLVCVLLFGWNLGISVYNSLQSEIFEIQGLFFPLIIALSFNSMYRKLFPYRELIDELDADTLLEMELLCKGLIKAKLADNPDIVRARLGRVRLMGDRAFLVRNDQTHAFVVTREQLRNAVRKPAAKCLKLRFAHPLGESRFDFDRKNSNKLRDWFSLPALSPA